MPAVAELSPDLIMLTLRTADQDSATGQAIQTTAAAGGSSSIFVFIRNQSRIVDNYDLGIEGLPEEWVTISPATVYLVPYGTAGMSEQEVHVLVRPPRTPEAEARPWPFRIVALSKAQQASARSSEATLTIEPYTDIAIEVKPERASGRRKGDFTLMVLNKSNARTSVELAGEDEEQNCEVSFAESEVAVDPGFEAAVPLTVTPPKPIWLGRPQDRRLQLHAMPMGVDVPDIPRYATYRQLPWLPWWLAIVAPLLLLAIVLALLLLPKNVKVPDLSKAQGTLAAQKLLESQGLKLDPQVGQCAVGALCPSLGEKVAAGAVPGAIIGQSPDPGKTIKKGGAVTITVALAAGAGKKKVPDLVKKSPQDADAALRTESMVLGAIAPKPDPKGVIASQLPAAGAMVPAGTAVNVFLATVKKGGDKKLVAGAAVPGSAAAKAKAAAAKAAGAAIIVPKIAGQAAQDAATVLSQKTLVPVPINTFDPAKPGTVVGTLPAAGEEAAPQQKVNVLISVGYPRLTYDSGGNVFLADGGTGKRQSTLAEGSADQEDASWAADGQRTVFRGGGQLFLLDATKKGGTPKAITPKGLEVHDPAFAPTTKVDVIAAVQIKGGDGDLCFMRLAGDTQLAPDCVADPAINLGKHIAWSPDGRQILVPGVTPQGVFGLVLYQSDQPFASSAASWGKGTMVTDTSKAGRGMLDAAFSADGKQLAMIGNTDNSQGRFHVFVSKPDDFKPKKKAGLPVQACDVSWRPDGKELLITAFQQNCPSSPAEYVIERVSPADPSHPTVLVQHGRDPAWQPVNLAAAAPPPLNKK